MQHNYSTPELLYLRYREVEASASIKYTYVDEDYPLYYPVTSGPLPNVAMTMYESTHYSIEAPDNMSLAAAEWKLMSNTPTTFGRVRLGPEDRILLVTAWHFRHCLHSFQKTFAGLTDPASESAYYQCITLSELLTPVVFVYGREQS